MIRSFFRRGLRLGAVVGAFVFLLRVFQRRQSSPSPADTTPAPRPAPTPRPVEPAGGATGNGSTATLVAEPAAPPAVAPSPPSAEADEPAEAAEPKTASRSTTKPKAKKAAAPAEAKPKAKAGKDTKDTKPKARKKAPAVADTPAWVDPVEGAAPATHPVKAKVSSKIYHLPGMTAYDRTTPDRCYRDAESAEADGFRKAQR